jgi:hypothetical protein
MPFYADVCQFYAPYEIFWCVLQSSLHIHDDNTPYIASFASLNEWEIVGSAEFVI